MHFCPRNDCECSHTPLGGPSPAWPTAVRTPLVRVSNREACCRVARPGTSIRTPTLVTPIKYFANRLVCFTPPAFGLGMALQNPSVVRSPQLPRSLPTGPFTDFAPSKFMPRMISPECLWSDSQPPRAALTTLFNTRASCSNFQSCPKIFVLISNRFCNWPKNQRAPATYADGVKSSLCTRTLKSRCLLKYTHGLYFPPVASMNRRIAA